MTSYTTPARIRWARSNNPGEQPDLLAPGSMAVNWPDKKIYVGDGGALPSLFTQLIEEWTTGKVYQPGDIVLLNGGIWVATDTSGPTEPFDPTKWQLYTSAAAAVYAEPASSDATSGGEVSPNGLTGLSVAAGTGLVVDNTTSPPVAKEVSWSAFTVVGSDPGIAAWSVLGVDGNGNAFQSQLVNFDVEDRRDVIVLAYFLWNAAGEIISIVDGSRRARGTSETYIDEYQVNGGSYRAKGGKASGLPVTLSIQTSAAEVFSMGLNWRSEPKKPNIINVAAIAPITMSLIDRNGIVTSGTTLGDPDQYDLNGVLTPVPAGTASIQYLSSTPEMDTFYLQYGQSTYADIQQAVNNLAQDWEDLVKLLDGALGTMLIGAVIADQGSVNYDNARFINASRGRDPFEGYSEEVSTDEFYVLDGSRPLEGDMDGGGFNITNAVIDGGTMA